MYSIEMNSEYRYAENGSNARHKYLLRSPFLGFLTLWNTKPLFLLNSLTCRTLVSFSKFKLLS